MPPQEWLRKLANSEQDLEKNPSIKLVGFWRSKHEKTGENGVVQKGGEQGHADLIFETKRTIQDCPWLGLVKDPVSEGLRQRYIESWMKRWGRG